MTLRGCAVLALVLLCLPAARTARAQATEERIPLLCLAPDPGDTTALHDEVVVYLKEGKVVDGVLVAKGRGVIILMSADGRLTIPKPNIDRIEYIGLPNSEKGEPVRVDLVNGRTYEGRLRRENAATLSLDTSFGAIDIDKSQLLSLRYLGTAEYHAEEEKPAERRSPRLDRRSSRDESWAVSRASGFGTDYHSGYGLTYTRWAPVRTWPAVTLHATAGTALAYFGVNNDVKRQDVPGGVQASGRIVLWELNGGAPLTFRPAEGGLYRFHIVPSVGATLVSRRFELAYPSFPSNDRKDATTGLHFSAGFDFLFDFAVGPDNSVGFGFRQRYLAGGEPNYSDFVIYLARLHGLFSLPWS